MKQNKSRAERAEITCDHCGKKFETTLYPMLNIEEYPKLKSKLMDTSLFSPKCPYCGQRTNVPYSITYNDQKKKMILCMYCSEEEYNEALAMQKGSDPYAQMMRYINENGEVRIVRTPVDLAEKICIAEAHMDDRLMELMKFHLMLRLKETHPNADHMWFLIRDKKQYLLVSEKQQLLEIPFSNSWYQEAARAYGSSVRAMKNHPVVIDSAWAEKVLRPVKVNEPSSSIGFE